MLVPLVLALALQTTTTPPPAPQGAVQPQQTSPLPGATPATPTAPPAPVPSVPAPGQSVVSPPPLGRVFASDHGIIFNAIKPDRVMDFEMVLTKLRDALTNSKDPVRQQQGWGWKIYKQTEPGPNGSVLYVFVMDPAVKGADYGVAKILAEAYPNEIMELYRTYISAFATAGQTLINLQTFPPPPPVTTGTAGLGTEGATTPGTTAPGTTTPGTTTPVSPRPSVP